MGLLKLTDKYSEDLLEAACIFLKDGKVKEDLKRTGDKEQFYNEIITNWC